MSQRKGRKVITRATLTFVLEWEDDEIENDPKELLLEILADQPDEYLIDLIDVERITTP